MPERAVAGACTFVRALLARRMAASGLNPDTGSEQLLDDVVLRVGELVSAAVAQAGSEVEVVCRVEVGRESGTEVEVVCRAGLGRPQAGGPTEFATRLHLKPSPRAAGPEMRTPTPVQPAVGPPVRPVAPAGPAGGSGPRASIGPNFLAETSELLAGQLDEDLVAALASQLVVPRVAD
ncbi:hypothetical protein AB0N17_46640, partial [Streptomyces sp. NPDC051133]